MARRFAPLFLVLPLLAACGNNGSGISAEQACSDSAKATCAKLDQCRHNGTANAYGTLGNCISRVQANCLVALMAPGTGNTPDATESCATAMPMQSCQDYFQGNPVAACAQKTGSLSNGAACAFNAQCQTGFCGVKKGDLCGTCAPVPAVGDPCVDVTSCGPNRTCTPMQTCQAWVAVGGMCDGKNLVCAPGSACVIAAMMTMGTCQAEATMVGGTCDYKRQTGSACDPNLGLFCNNTNKCVSIMYVKAGGNCGSLNMGAADGTCTGGAGCYSAGAGMQAMCIALGQEGDACDLAVGPGCMSPGRCVVSGAGNAGTCTLPDPTMCM
jgi:hypothetical protein